MSAIIFVHLYERASLINLVNWRYTVRDLHRYEFQIAVVDIILYCHVLLRYEYNISVHFLYSFNTFLLTIFSIHLLWTLAPSSQRNTLLTLSFLYFPCEVNSSWEHPECNRNICLSRVYLLTAYVNMWHNRWHKHTKVSCICTSSLRSLTAFSTALSCTNICSFSSWSIQ